MERALVGLQCPAGCSSHDSGCLETDTPWPAMQQGVVLVAAQESLCALQDTLEASACDRCGAKATDAQLRVLQQASDTWRGLEDGGAVTSASVEQMVQVLEVGIVENYDDAIACILLGMYAGPPVSAASRQRVAGCNMLLGGQGVRTVGVHPKGA